MARIVCCLCRVNDNPLELFQIIVFQWRPFPKALLKHYGGRLKHHVGSQNICKDCIGSAVFRDDGTLSILHRPESVPPPTPPTR